jgi:hypothetical protein
MDICDFDSDRYEPPEPPSPPTIPKPAPTPRLFVGPCVLIGWGSILLLTLLFTWPWPPDSNGTLAFWLSLLFISGGLGVLLKQRIDSHTTTGMVCRSIMALNSAVVSLAFGALAAYGAYLLFF